jgi:hypothetical protein
MLKRHQHSQNSLDGYHMIDAAIDKLEEYRQEIDDIPAYTLSIGKYLLFFTSIINT